MTPTFSAPFVLEYAYKRSLGAVLGRFMTGLRDRVLLGVRTDNGRVLFPPSEYDPANGHSVTDDWVEVGPEGVVQSYTWVAEPRDTHPCSEPFGFGLVRLDGADTDVLHVLLGGGSDLRIGVRVRVVWADETVGHIRDIAGFEVCP